MLAVVFGSALATAVPAGRRGAAVVRAAPVCGASTGSALGSPCQKPRSLMMSFAVVLARATRLAACAGAPAARSRTRARSWRALRRRLRGRSCDFVGVGLDDDRHGLGGRRCNLEGLGLGGRLAWRPTPAGSSRGLTGQVALAASALRQLLGRLGERRLLAARLARGAGDRGRLGRRNGLGVVLVGAAAEQLGEESRLAAGARLRHRDRFGRSRRRRRSGWRAGPSPSRARAALPASAASGARCRYPCGRSPTTDR